MKYLGWIAVGGLAIGIGASGLASTISDDDDGFSTNIARQFHRGFSWKPWWPHDWNVSVDGDCYDGAAASQKESEHHWAWDGGDSIVIALPAEVHYRGGEGTEVIVRGDPEAVARVHVGGGKIIAACGGLHGGDVDITLPGRVFENVLLKGSAHLTMENIHQPELSLDIAGSGRARASGTVDKLRTSISGSGKITFGDLAMKDLNLNIAGSGEFDGTGKSDAAKVAIEGSGNADLAEMPMNEINISIAGNGEVAAAPKNSADITIMGSGKAVLLTRPDHVNTSIMGSGKVVQMPVKTGNET